MTQRFDIQSSLVLSSAVSVAADSGYTQPNKIEDLRNPHRGGMLIDEIRFEVDNTGFWSGPDLDPLVDFRIGQHLFNHVPVPIYMLGRRDPMSKSELSWRPRHPIYVPEGRVLTPRFMNKKLTSSAFTEIFTITYLGRSLTPGQPPPQEIVLPWLSAYYPTAYPEDGSLQEQKSTPNDLVNSTRDVVEIDYLLNNAYLNGSASEFARVKGYEQTFVRAFDRNEKPIVREPIPLRSVFALQDGAWDLRMRLDPGDFITLEVTVEPATHTGTFDLPVFSMIGHREVRL